MFAVRLHGAAFQLSLANSALPVAKWVKAIKYYLWLKEGRIRHLHSMCLILFIIPSGTADILAWSTLSQGCLHMGVSCDQWQHRETLCYSHAILTVPAACWMWILGWIQPRMRRQGKHLLGWCWTGVQERRKHSEFSWELERRVVLVWWGMDLFLARFLATTCLAPHLQHRADSLGWLAHSPGCFTTQRFKELTERRIESQTRALVWV